MYDKVRLYHARAGILVRSKKVFSTVFSEMKNIHLVKDPGMIPFTMQNDYGFHSVVPISSLNEYPYLKDHFHDIETPVICDSPKIKIKHVKRLWWIYKNSKKIDVLHLYFFNISTWLGILLYKKRNKKGLIYVHCDTDGQYLLKYDFQKKNIRNFCMKYVFYNSRFLNDVLWGIQNSDNEKLISRKWPFLNTAFVPNGVFWPSFSDTTNKARILLTVSRNGSPEKNTDMLLEAFAAISDKYPDWNLRLVGSIENKFMHYIKDYFVRHPELVERISFAGVIMDRILLEREYSRAKVFCIPSSWESFGIATIEALSRGCFIIGSDIPSNKQITVNERFGILFKNGNLQDFIDKLDYVLGNEKLIDKTSNDAIKYAEMHYYWKDVLKPIYDWINSKT